MNKTEKDVATKAASVWRVLTAYTWLYDPSRTPLPPWNPASWNLRTNFSTLLRVFEWRYVLTPFAISMNAHNIRHEELGVFENITIREAFIFGIRVARWIVKKEWMRDPRYTAALAGAREEQNGTTT